MTAAGAGAGAGTSGVAGTAGIGADPLGEDVATAALTLARRFAAGATLWCVAPTWPAHGDHVAVEFVHPVVMGKPALPAVHVTEPDALRLLGHPGDVVLAVGLAGDVVLEDLLLRADAWGLTCIRLGAGPRPRTRAVEHVIWVEHVDPATVAWTGDLVLRYHLLWELTHVVLEHPGLLRADDACDLDRCTTCADAGSVAEVRRLGVGAQQAEVVVGGAVEPVDVSLLEHVAPGDLVLVHAGVALTALGDPAAGGVEAVVR